MLKVNCELVGSLFSITYYAYVVRDVDSSIQCNRNKSLSSRQSTTRCFSTRAHNSMYRLQYHSTCLQVKNCFLTALPTASRSTVQKSGRTVEPAAVHCLTDRVSERTGQRTTAAFHLWEDRGRCSSYNFLERRI